MTKEGLEYAVSDYVTVAGRCTRDRAQRMKHRELTYPSLEILEVWGVKCGA